MAGGKTRPLRRAKTIARLTGDGMSEFSREYYIVVVDGRFEVCTSDTDERVVSAGEDVVRVVVKYVDE